VLVGTKNVAASRTAKGQQNLNALFTEVVSIYGASGLHIGAINAYEWPCESGGDVYANVASGDLGTMFTASKTMFPSATETKALNVFLVSTIPYSSSSGLTILGISGGIGGSMINGTAISGLAFSSFNKLGTYNAGCTGTGTCARAQQEAEFVDMGGTIAHEMGHYLGLNHPSESDGATHDVLRDTPKCTYLGGGTYISISSCRTSTSAQAVYQPSGNKCSTAGVCTGYSPSTGVFCAAAPECQFNHTMWWTSKNFDEASGTGDGNLFSPDSTTLMDYNPYIQ
jgi:hypothetical protein